MTDDKLPESIVLKLFDQVKDSSDQNTEQIKDVRNATDELIKLIEVRPDPKTMEEAYRGVQTVVSNVEDIKKSINWLSVKVIVMIAAVVVAFTVLAVVWTPVIKIP